MGEHGRADEPPHRQTAPPRALLGRTSGRAGWLGADLLLLRAARALGPAVDPAASALSLARPCSPRSIVYRSAGEEACSATPRRCHSHTARAASLSLARPRSLRRLPPPARRRRKRQFRLECDVCPSKVSCAALCRTKRCWVLGRVYVYIKIACVGGGDVAMPSGAKKECAALVVTVTRWSPSTHPRARPPARPRAQRPHAHTPPPT